MSGCEQVFVGAKTLVFTRSTTLPDTTGHEMQNAADNS